MGNELPAIIGTGALLGRPAVRPVNDDVERPVGYDEDGNPVYETVLPPAESAGIPASCLRVLNSPLPVERGGGCALECPGRQRDGSCLCDVVRAAFAEGTRLDQLRFEVDEDGYWKPVGSRTS